MVKNQNWQTRVETADARRKLVQRKQVVLDRRQHKSYTQEFLSTLERIEEEKNGLLLLKDHVKYIHIWSDQVVEEAAGVGDDDNVKMNNVKVVNNNKSNHRRQRAASMDDGTSSSLARSNGNNKKKNRQQQRNRSNSVHDDGSKHHSTSRNEHSLQLSSPLFCRAQFFQVTKTKYPSTTAATKRNSSTGRDDDDDDKYKTLGQVVVAGTTTRAAQAQARSQEEVLAQSRQAALAQQERTGIVDMVHYFCIDVCATTTTDDRSSSSSSSLCDQLTTFVSKRHISLSSIVYIVMNNVLVFDRNRQGLLYKNDTDLMHQLLGKDCVSSSSSSSLLLKRKSSMESTQQHQEEDGTTTGDEETSSFVTNLPGEILEHVLTFLPDGAVPTTCLVCHPWHSQIGATPNLWRHMLERRRWPVPVPPRPSLTNGDDHQDDDARSSQRQVFRQAFVQHYGTIRDVAAIRMGLTALVTKHRAVEKEMTYQDFSTRRDAPSGDLNRCVSIHVWSPRHVLAAYRHDCTLRLFESSLKSSDNQEKICREVLCHNIDPFAGKTRCYIEDMGVDESYIGCLCSADPLQDLDETFLIFLSRDDFLLGGTTAATATTSSSAASPAVIDIGQAVLNFILSSDEVDRRFRFLTDFIDLGGGRIFRVPVFVTNLVVCGQGRFMIGVEISVPRDDQDDDDVDDDDDPYWLNYRTLVLISAEMGAVLWVDLVTEPAVPDYQTMRLSSMTLSSSGGLDCTCDVAVGSPSSPSVTVFGVDPIGQVHRTELHVALQSVETWRASESYRQSLLITSSDVLIGDVVDRVATHVALERKSFITFVPRNPSLDRTCSTVELPGSLDITSMARLRGEYAIIICRSLDAASPLFDIHAFVFHIPTRCRVGRFCLLENVPERDSHLRITSSACDTLGAALSCKGIVMSGNDVRYVDESKSTAGAPSDSSSPQSGRKKGGKLKREGKKDEFARGMRQSF